MSLGRRFAVTAVVAALVAGLSTGGSAWAGERPAAARNSLSAAQTANAFLKIAYTWKTSWYSSNGPIGPSIGKRDKPYAAQALDTVLKKVVIAPETSANVISFTPRNGTVLSTKSLPGGVKAILFNLPVVLGGSGASGTYHAMPSVRVKMGKNGWKAVGTALPTASGPAKYCVDSPAAAQHCNIYPPGSN